MAAAPQKAPNDAGAEAGGKKKKKLMLMIGLAVALVAVSIGGTVAALKILAPAPAATEEAAAEETEKESTLAPAIYFDMAPNFTINFNVNGRQRYLQAAMTLLLRDPALEELLKLHMPAIRNGLVMLLSSKNFEELQTPEGKETLKEEALEIINKQLKKEQQALAEKSEDEEKPKITQVEEVLFTNFVMQ